MEMVSICGSIESSKKEQTLAEKLQAKSIIAPKLIRRVESKYPLEATQKQVEGEVILRGTTDLEGNVKKLEVLKDNDLLAKETIKAVRQWKYIPWEIDGVTKPVEFSMAFIFRLKKVPANKVNTLIKDVLKANDDLMKGKKKIPIIIEVSLVEGSH